MTLPKQQKIKEQNIKSMKNAVEEVGIQAIHPDKMEDFAEYMVQSLKSSEIVDDYVNKLIDSPDQNRRGGKLSE